jgi:hypothetical protein
MRKLFTLAAVASALAIASFSSAYAGKGNNLPSGYHYNLTIIGVDQAKKPPMTGSNGHTIFMPLVTAGDPVNGPNGGEPDGSVSNDSAIYLQQGSTFQVCDANGFDPAHDCSGNLITGGGVQGDGATFQLPCDTINGGTVNTCADTPGGTNQSASYSVYAAALGTPGGKASLTTCAFDTTDNTEVCNSANTVLIRDSSKPKWNDVTQNLTTLTCSTSTCPLLCPSGTCTFVLFSSEFQNFLWDYDNNSLRNAQIRFYLNPS